MPEVDAVQHGHAQCVATAIGETAQQIPLEAERQHLCVTPAGGRRPRHPDEAFVSALGVHESGGPDPFAGEDGGVLNDEALGPRGDIPGLLDALAKSPLGSSRGSLGCAFAYKRPVVALDRSWSASLCCEVPCVALRADDAA